MNYDKLKKGKKGDPLTEKVHMKAFAKTELCPKLGSKSKGYPSFESTYQWVTSSIRLGEVAKLLEDKALVFEHTFSFAEYMTHSSFTEMWGEAMTAQRMR